MDPDSSSWIAVAVLVLGLALTALASAADTALRSLNKARVVGLIEGGVPKARLVHALLENPGVSAATILAANAVSLTASVSAATVLAFWVFQGSLLGVLTSLVLLVLLLLLAQVSAKSLASHNPEQAALVLASPLRGIALALWPATKFVSLFTGRLGRLLGAKPLTPLVTEEEVMAWLDVGEEAGVIEEEEREMIDSILELEETTAREIMVPRMDIVATDLQALVAEAIDLALKHGYSRIPVCGENIDNIVGVLYAKDLLKYLKEGELSARVGELMRPAYYIPETKKLNELLHEMQQRKVHMAIVVDEYGGVGGIVTIEDLLEEIVGEIQDEYDREEAKIVKLNESEALFDSTVSMADVNDALSIKLEAEEAATIGGLVYEKLDKVPSVGDNVEINGVTVTVQATVGRRIKRVKVVNAPKQEPSEEEQT